MPLIMHSFYDGVELQEMKMNGEMEIKGEVKINIQKNTCFEVS